MLVISGVMREHFCFDIWTQRTRRRRKGHREKLFSLRVLPRILRGPQLFANAFIPSTNTSRFFVVVYTFGVTRIP